MRKNQGATLIELAVAIAVITVLSGVALASYQVVQSRTMDNIAASNLESAATAQMRHHQTRGRYALAEADLVSLGLRDISITSGASTGPTVISAASEQEFLILTTLSKSGDCILLLADMLTATVNTTNLGRTVCISEVSYARN